MPKPRCSEFWSKFGVFCSIRSKIPNFGVTKNSAQHLCSSAPQQHGNPSSPKLTKKEKSSSLVVQQLGSLEKRKQQLSTSAEQGTDTVASY